LNFFGFIEYIIPKLETTVEVDKLRPENVEVLIEDEHVKDTFDTFHLIRRVMTMTLDRRKK